jgi:cation:H+ antiporter
MVVGVVKLTIFGVSIFLMFFLSKYLVDSLTHFSKKLRVSEFMIGSIILAIGTSLPEIIDTLVASSLKLGELAAGILIGSNISNILFILGVAALIKPISNISKTILKESYVLLIVMAIFFLMGLDATISRLEGLVLLGAFAAYHWFLHREDMHIGGMVYAREIEADIVLTPIAISTILLCGWLVVNTGASIAADLNIPLPFFGLIIMAITTSLPELSSSIISARGEHSKLVIGNVFGSNAANILLAGGLAALVNPISFSGSISIYASLIFLFAVSAVFTLFIHHKKRVGRHLAVALLLSYLAYLIIITIYGGVV